MNRNDVDASPDFVVDAWTYPREVPCSPLPWSAKERDAGTIQDKYGRGMVLVVPNSSLGFEESRLEQLANVKIILDAVNGYKDLQNAARHACDSIAQLLAEHDEMVIQTNQDLRSLRSSLAQLRLAIGNST